MNEQEECDMTSFSEMSEIEFSAFLCRNSNVDMAAELVPSELTKTESIFIIDSN